MRSSLGFAPQRDEFGSTGHPVPFVHHPFHEAEAAPGQESKDKPWSDLGKEFPTPWPLTAACCSVLQFSSTRSSFCCVWGAVALSWLSPKRSNVFPSREKLLQVMQALAGKGWCSWIPGTDLMCRDWDAPIAKKPCPDANLWAFGCFFSGWSCLDCPILYQKSQESIPSTPGSVLPLLPLLPPFQTFQDPPLPQQLRWAMRYSLAVML